MNRDTSDAAVEAADRRARLEFDLVTDLLRFPVRGIGLARAASVTAADFDQPDLQAIFIALDWSCDNRHANAMLAVRRALQAAGFWRWDVPRGSRGMYHGPASIGGLVYGSPPCPALIPLMLLQLKAVGAEGRAA